MKAERTVVTAPCTACGATGARRWRRDRGWHVVQCLGCGLARTWPPPPPEELEALYDQAYYDERVTARDHDWDGRATQVLGLLVDRGAGPVLDVGAGDGGLVAALRRRAVAAEGVETSDAGRRRARDRGVELHESLDALGDQRFGAATLLHVVEHVPDPVAFLRDVGARLEPGAPVLVEVPNATAPDARLPWLRGQVLDLPFHLHHFGPRSLADVATRAGLVAGEPERSNPAVLEWAMARRARGRPVPTTAAEHASRPAPDASADTDGRASGGAVARIWRRALPAIRQVAPGIILRLVARRPDSSG